MSSYDRELPSNVTNIDFEPCRTPEVHLPADADVDTSSPVSLFLLFFGTDLVNKIVEFTNMEGRTESTKVIGNS